MGHLKGGALPMRIRQANHLGRRPRPVVVLGRVAVGSIECRYGTLRAAWGGDRTKWQMSCAPRPLMNSAHVFGGCGRRVPATLACAAGALHPENHACMQALPRAMHTAGMRANEMHNHLDLVRWQFEVGVMHGTSVACVRTCVVAGVLASRFSHGE